MRNHPRQARTEQRRRPEQIALLCFFHIFHFATQVTTKTSNSTEQASWEGNQLEKRDLGELRVFGRWVHWGGYPRILQNWDKIQPMIVLRGLSSATFWKDRRCILIRLNTKQRQTLWREEPKRAMPRQVREWNIQSWRSKQGKIGAISSFAVRVLIFD